MVRTAACDRTVRQHTRRDVLGDAVERSARERRAEMDAELGTHALAEEPRGSRVLSASGRENLPRRPNRRGVGLSIARRGRPRRERRVVRAAFRALGRPRRAREDARGELAGPRGRGRRAHARGLGPVGRRSGRRWRVETREREEEKKAGQEEQAPRRLEARQGLFGLCRTNETRPWWPWWPRRPRWPRRQGEGRFED